MSNRKYECDRAFLADGSEPNGTYAGEPGFEMAPSICYGCVANGSEMAASAERGFSTLSVPRLT